MSFKRKVNLFLQNKPSFARFFRFATRANLILFHWNERFHFVSYGKENPEKKYYVVRPRGKDEGLLSSAFAVIREVKWARDNGYIPYVDFRSSICQYHVDRLVNGTDNAWEYFFLQPEKLSLDELKTKKNVALGGWGFESRNLRSIDISNEKIRFQPYVMDMADDYLRKEFDGKKVLGVFVRGTDYVALKPKNHPIQPSINDVKNKIDEFMQKYAFDKIYVVTEDFSYFDFLYSSFPGKVCSYGENFVKDYNGHDYVSNSFHGDAYERGLNYLIRIIVLSKCSYVICSKASGSAFAELIREKEPVAIYWFDLGLY